MISVVIPLYNKDHSIKRAITSVVTQTFSKIEVLVINDGSTDSSLQQALSISDKRITVISQKNKGVSSARNLGLSMAKSDYVAFLDADDEWHEEFLQEINSLMVYYPGCGIYASAYAIVENGEVIISKLPYPDGGYQEIENIFDDFRLFYPFNSSSVVVNKKILSDLGGFPESVRAGEDVITWFKLGLCSKIAFVNKPLSFYHHDAENRTWGNLPVPETYAPVIYLSELLATGKINCKYKDSVWEYIVRHELSSAKALIRNKKTLKALCLLWKLKNTQKQRRLWVRLLLFALFTPIFPHLIKRV